MHGNVRECYGMLGNVRECWGMLWNVGECEGIFRNDNKEIIFSKKMIGIKIER